MSFFLHSLAINRYCLFCIQFHNVFISHYKNQNNYFDTKRKWDKMQILGKKWFMFETMLYLFRKEGYFVCQLHRLMKSKQKLNIIREKRRPFCMMNKKEIERKYNKAKSEHWLIKKHKKRFSWKVNEQDLKSNFKHRKMMLLMFDLDLIIIF